MKTHPNRIKPKLSVLIPAVPSRMTNRTWALFRKLVVQSQACVRPLDVEVLVLLDNKRRSIGLKRDALLRAARGAFIVIIDDDDDVADDYVPVVLRVIDENPDVDVIVYDEMAQLETGPPFIVSFSLAHDNDPVVVAEDGSIPPVRRKPWHQCPWAARLAKSVRFPDASVGEDWAWAKQVIELGAKTEARIDRVMRYYRRNEVPTEADGSDAVRADGSPY